MRTRKNIIALIFLIALSVLTTATEYNLLAIEPLGLFNNTFSGYYSKISPKNGAEVTVPLKYQEKSDANSLSTGIEYRKYLMYGAQGFYFETSAYAQLHDQKGPDSFALTPSFVIGYKIDTQQGLFVEPELVFSLPLIATNGGNLEVSQTIDSTFNIILGLDNVYPNGMFFAPRLIFSYRENELEAIGRLFIGYGF